MSIGAMNRTRMLLVAAAVVVLGGAWAARGAVISVNFVGGQPAGASSVTAAAGVVSASNWNNEANAAATGVSVVDSSNASAATLTYSAPNNWAASGTTPAGGSDAAMMNGYLDNFQNSPSSISITGLGAAFTAGGYDVIVYQNADSAGSWGYTVTDNASHSGTRYGQQLAGGGANYPLAGGTNGYVQGTSTSPVGSGTASNYIRITGLTGSSFTITGNSGTTGDGRVRPNGFQIVSVPEPTSLASAGVAALGLLARRRRSA